MNTIDQRILIPTSPETIWSIISNMSMNPQWQSNCTGVNFISQHNRGQGTRFRCEQQRGRDQIIDIAAWYEGVGYAYVIVEGVPFKNNRGTIRLQEIAEGTIVQWMYEYAMSGVFSGVRNTVATRRTLENSIIESLETLWRVATQSSEQEGFVSRTLMRDAPDVEARSQYTPRHPSMMQQDSAAQVHFDEPPVDEEDTQPGPPAVTESPAPKVAPISGQDRSPLQEPDFLADYREEPRLEPSGFNLPQLPREQVSTQPPQQDRFEHSEQEADSAEKETTEVSVFDLFGVPKPSETQQIAAVDTKAPETVEATAHLEATPLTNEPVPVDETPEIDTQEFPVFQEDADQNVIASDWNEPSTPARVVSEEVSTFQSTGGRIGLRYVLRRNLVKTRRP